MKPTIKDILKEDKPSKGQAEGTLVYYRKSPLKEDNLSTRTKRLKLVLKVSFIKKFHCIFSMQWLRNSMGGRGGVTPPPPNFEL